MKDRRYTLVVLGWSKEWTCNFMRYKLNASEEGHLVVLIADLLQSQLLDIGNGLELLLGRPLKVCMIYLVTERLEHRQLPNTLFRLLDYCLRFRWLDNVIIGLHELELGRLLRIGVQNVALPDNRVFGRLWSRSLYFLLRPWCSLFFNFDFLFETLLHLLLLLFGVGYQ